MGCFLSLHRTSVLLAVELAVCYVVIVNRTSLIRLWVLVGCAEVQLSVDFARSAGKVFIQ